MVGTSILGSWNSHWSESHSNQNGRYRVKNPTWTRSLFLPAPAFGGMESNNGLQNGDTMVILWWYFENQDGIIHIYILYIYSYCILVKWYFYLQKCGCWPSMIGTNPCSPSVKTGLPRPRGIRWTGGEGEWVHNELVVTIWEKQGASGSCVEILYIYIYLYWLYI
jgi:hypothetical protein